MNDFKDQSWRREVAGMTLVDEKGIEPSASALRTPRSPN
jgi:hypothetical protein